MPVLALAPTTERVRHIPDARSRTRLSLDSVQTSTSPSRSQVNEEHDNEGEEQEGEQAPVEVLAVLRRESTDHRKDEKCDE